MAQPATLSPAAGADARRARPLYPGLIVRGIEPVFHQPDRAGGVGAGNKGRATAQGAHRRRAERPPHVMVTEPMKHEARVLAHAAELALTQFEGRYLLL